MKRIVTDSLNKELSLPHKGPVFLAIGMFDGVHTGHCAVLGTCLNHACQAAGQAGVLTFHPHPSRLFHPENPVLLIQEPWMKEIRLARMGFAFLIEQHFQAEFASVETKDFPALLQRALPELQAVYVGENWRYGKGRTGDVSTLTEGFGQLGVRVFSQARVESDGESVSSTRIRRLLEAGEIGQANDLLGYAYFARSTVIAGRQLGRTIGFPTLNLPWNPELKPRYGVYEVRVLDANDRPLGMGIANYGMRPTVEQSAAEPLLEVHLLDNPSSMPGSGEILTVEWLKFIRPETRFTSVEELREQIARDVATVRG